MDIVTIPIIAIYSKQLFFPCDRLDKTGMHKYTANKGTKNQYTFSILQLINLEKTSLTDNALYDMTPLKHL